MRYAPPDHLILIEQLIARDQGATRRELAEACRCTRETISRYLRFLKDVLGVDPQRIGYGPHRKFVWAYGHPGIFSEQVTRHLAARARREVMA